MKWVVTVLKDYKPGGSTQQNSPLSPQLILRPGIRLSNSYSAIWSLIFQKQKEIEATSTLGLLFFHHWLVTYRQKVVVGNNRHDDGKVLELSNHSDGGDHNHDVDGDNVEDLEVPNH